MSKRAQAFQKASTNQAAGHTRIEKSVNRRDRSIDLHGNKFLRYQSFDPTRLMLVDLTAIRPGELWSYQFRERSEAYFNEEIKPWLEENGITKYKLHYLNNERTDNPDIARMYRIGNSGYYSYMGMGLTFKRQRHALLFKLRF